MIRRISTLVFMGGLLLPYASGQATDMKILEYVVEPTPFKAFQRTRGRTKLIKEIAPKSGRLLTLMVQLRPQHDEKKPIVHPTRFRLDGSGWSCPSIYVEAGYLGWVRADKAQASAGPAMLRLLFNVPTHAKGMCKVMYGERHVSDLDLDVPLTKGDVALREVHQAELERDLDSIILPRVSFGDASVGAVVRYLQQRSKDLNPDGHMVNLVVATTDKDDAGITTDLKNVSLRSVYKLVADNVDAGLFIEPHAVLVHVGKPPMKMEVAGSEASVDTLRVRRFLKTVHIPRFVCASADLATVCRFLSKRSVELDPYGVGVVVKSKTSSITDGIEGQAGSLDQGLSLHLDDVPIWDILRYLCLLNNSQLRITSDGVIIEPFPSE